ncbi:MAG: DUF6476 family protein [Rhodospirillales bacterium]|nr:DUF6476 family protein [Rhodospirillales bacterium]
MQKNKALVLLVMGLSVILIGGFALLVYGLVQQASNPDFKFFKSSEAVPADVKAKPPANISIPIPQGSKVGEIEVSEGKIIVHLTTETRQDRILILDAETGVVIRRIRLEPQR